MTYLRVKTKADTENKAGGRRSFTEIGCRVILFVIGAGLVAAGSQSVWAQSSGDTVSAFQTSFRELDCGVCAILAFLEGSYGALLTTMAGVSAIVAAGFANYKMAYNMMIVSASCFTIRAFLSAYYADYECSAAFYPSVHGIEASGDSPGCAQPVGG